MSDFWEKKRQELNIQPKPPVQSSGPWWSRGTNMVPQQPTVSQNGLQNYPGSPQLSDPNRIDGHDVSKAEILRGRAEECPYCPRNPKTGIRGNMYRPSPSMAMRCFDCGYMENNRFQGQTQGMSAVSEGPAHRARQTDSGGGIIHNYQGDSGKTANVVGRIS